MLATARLIAPVLLATPCIAVAHHSHGEFSDETLTLQGELTEVVWRNPHPALTLRVDGVSWRVQVIGNVNGLRRTGVSGDELVVGERITLQGHPSRRRDGLLLATVATTETGAVVILGPDESTGQALYRVGQADGDATATEEPESMFRVWMVANRVRNDDLPLTAEAAAAKATWDPLLDDPQRGCRPLGMPGAMMSPHPIEIREQGDTIVIRLEEWNAVRTIHMGVDAPRSTVAPSLLGFSTGRWEENELVVTTTHIDYPYMDEHGTPQSDAVRVVERFTPAADFRTMDWAAEITDPGTMTEPVIAFTTRWRWVPGESIQDYDCQELDPI